MGITHRTSSTRYYKPRKSFLQVIILTGDMLEMVVTWTYVQQSILKDSLTLVKGEGVLGSIVTHFVCKNHKEHISKSPTNHTTKTYSRFAHVKEIN